MLQRWVAWSLVNATDLANGPALQLSLKAIRSFAAADVGHNERQLLRVS